MLISIGQFSKICSVSVKTLRHYDKLGLLKPAMVDELTSYRYYNEEQLDTMLVINRLKRYGFSLAEIKAFINEKDKGILFLALQQRSQALQSNIIRMNLILKELDGIIKNYERTGEIMDHNSNYTINLTQTKALPILSTRQRMSVEDFGKYYGILFAKIAREGITTAGSVLAVYHDKEFDENNSDIEVGISITDEKKATRLIEGGLCATTTHTGSYANLTEAYAAVVKWINANGYEIAAPPYEIYRKSHVDNIPVNEWETDIYFPVKECSVD